MELKRLIEAIDFIVDVYVYGKTHGSVSTFKRTRKPQITRDHINALLDAIETLLHHLRFFADIGEKELQEYFVFRLFEAYDSLARAYKKFQTEVRKKRSKEVEDGVDILSEKLIRRKLTGKTEEEDKE